MVSNQEMVKGDMIRSPMLKFLTSEPISLIMPVTSCLPFVSRRNLVKVYVPHHKARLDRLNALHNVGTVLYFSLVTYPENVKIADDRQSVIY